MEWLCALCRLHGGVHCQGYWRCASTSRFSSRQALPHPLPVGLAKVQRLPGYHVAFYDTAHCRLPLPMCRASTVFMRIRREEEAGSGESTRRPSMLRTRTLRSLCALLRAMRWVSSALPCVLRYLQTTACGCFFHVSVCVCCMYVYVCVGKRITR